jgi:hypothetical protein
MSPRDVVDPNPAFNQARWETYLAFVREQLGHVHVQDREESEYDPMYDAVDESVESEGEVWGVGPPEEFEIYDEEQESRIQEIMEFLDSLGPDVGTRENPIDLTMDSE